jgi:hypothetical protein
MSVILIELAPKPLYVYCMRYAVSVTWPRSIR